MPLGCVYVCTVLYNVRFQKVISSTKKDMTLSFLNLDSIQSLFAPSNNTNKNKNDAQLSRVALFGVRCESRNIISPSRPTSRSSESIHLFRFASMGSVVQPCEQVLLVPHE